MNVRPHYPNDNPWFAPSFYPSLGHPTSMHLCCSLEISLVVFHYPNCVSLDVDAIHRIMYYSSNLTQNYNAGFVQSNVKSYEHRDIMIGSCAAVVPSCK